MDLIRINGAALVRGVEYADPRLNAEEDHLRARKDGLRDDEYGDGDDPREDLVEPMIEGELVPESSAFVASVAAAKSKRSSNPMAIRDPQYAPPRDDDGLWLDGPPPGSPEHAAWGSVDVRVTP